MTPILPLEHYKFARDERFRQWWISDRKGVIIYTFYDFVPNVKEASQLLRRKFSGETTLAIRALTPEIYALNDEQERQWIVLEVLIQPQRSYMFALKRGLKINRGQEATVVPAISRSAAGAYMIMRFSGLPLDDGPEVCADKVRRSMGKLFPFWHGEKIRVRDVFAETIDEEDAVRYHGSIVAILDDDYYIPQHNLETGLAYISEYDIQAKFESIGPFHYSAYCSACHTIDSHTTENCKYFKKEYPGGIYS
ncbi:hypothetical protein BJV82DRAFT_595485 [Fennellomyces sp. T-0311]|nr:hypothetical protein BJV82DRAFT_595485 [Fennellomyces sp. T-0311]